jgi:hypothetical protein
MPKLIATFIDCGITLTASLIFLSLYFKPGANRSKRSKWGLALALFMVFLTLFDIVSAVR